MRNISTMDESPKHQITAFGYCPCRNCKMQLKVGLVLFGLWLVFFAGMVSGTIPGMVNLPEIKDQYMELFENPISDVRFSDVMISHGEVHFLAESDHPQVLRKNRGFRQIKIADGKMQPSDLGRYTQCFFQPNNSSLPGNNEVSGFMQTHHSAEYTLQVMIVPIQSAMRCLVRTLTPGLTPCSQDS